LNPGFNRDRLRAYLRRGQIIAYPTRGCFGLGCLPNHPLALKRLIRLKGRPQKKGMIVVADKLTALSPLIAPLSPELKARAMAQWPGHWTWVVPARRGVSPLLRGRHRTLAVRLDNYPPVRALCGAIGALTSTSANRAGEKPLRFARSVRQRFGSSVKVLPGHCERGARPSTVADLLTGKLFRA
jgi:L-threonylcarbamoyladenylate synthase